MLKANDPLIPGVDFTIGGEVYTAPPLTLGGIKAVLPRLNGNDADKMSVILCVSLKRNYPEVTQPWLDDNMTGLEFSENTSRVLELMTVSGLVRAKDADAGEAVAAA